MRAIIPAVLMLAACQQVDPTTEAEGAQFYSENCVVCHGAPGAAPLLEDAPDLTRLAARNGGRFPRNHVMSTIDGYRRGEHFSAVMPVFGEDGLGEIEIVDDGEGNGTPVPRKLLALADYLEGIQIR